jgi:DNA-binding transcriptional MerR regulator
MKRIARRKRRFEIPVPRADEGVGYSVETAAQLTGIRPELIRYYCERRLISPVAEREPGNFIFDAPALCAMRRITVLRHEHGLDFATAQIVADLLQQIDELRRRAEV